MSLNRAWIETHIPHRGSMCLLDEVLHWDAAGIRCRAGTHRCVSHPLRRHGRLGAACGIEYAAQTMAVHGALAAPPRATAQARAEFGFLAGLRDVQLFADRLDEIDGDLICEATQLAGDASMALYSFAVGSAAGPLLRGRATVILDGANRMRL